MLKIKNYKDTAEIYISGAIVDDDIGGYLEAYNADAGYEWPSDIKKQLDEIGDKDLTVYINSDGGSVPAGVAIANMIARHKGHTTAVVDGWACSIATQIFFAADTRRIPSNAYLMIHKPSCALAGDANDFRHMIETLDVIQEGLETTYCAAAREGVTPEQIHQMVEDTTWLTGEKARELFNIETVEATKTAACVSSDMLLMIGGNMPKGFAAKLDLNDDIEPKATAAPTEDIKKNNINAQRAEIELALTEGELL